MSVLSGLEPKSVFHFFEEISAIPRASGNMEAISRYCLDFAEKRGLEAWRDDCNNVVIISPASAGYEDHDTVILQGHLDMVAEKTDDCDIDFTKDGIRLVVDGDWLKADGTTLGADNGIAVAYALAILDDPSLPHPRLEAVFTTDEETGMNGVLGLDCSRLQGRKLLNLDSDREKIFVVGCAGGARADCRIPTQSEPCADPTVTLSLNGLRGGHSGGAIASRASAIKLMIRALDGMGPFRLVSIHGGTKHNAIPRDCEAVIAVKSPEKVQGLAAGLEQQFREENPKDVDLSLTATAGGPAGRALTAESTAQVMTYLREMPHGPAEMDPDFPKQALTSDNLAIVETEGTALHALVSVRSGREGGIPFVMDRVLALTKRFGGSAETTDGYPAWVYRKDSPFRSLMEQIYREQFGGEPQIYVTHGGLECGILAKKIPGADVASYGPDIYDLHNPQERLSISSTERVWGFLLELLKRC